MEGNKTGRVEDWKDGRQGTPILPFFQSSSLPFFLSSNLPFFHSSILPIFLPVFFLCGELLDCKSKPLRLAPPLGANEHIH